MKRDLARLLDDARLRGWTIEKTRSSHWRLKHPRGAIVVAGGTLTCPRALRNIEADLRRAERRAP